MGRPCECAVIPRWLHAPPPGPGETAVSLIDLGTNSIRMDLVAVRGKQARRLHREKRMVRLGDGLYEGGRPSAEALERVEHALQEFATLHHTAQVRRVRAVATAAMREAPQAAELVESWKQRYGIAFQIISGAEEAALIARGVLSVERPPAGPYALIDIGGGSTELSLCQDGKVLESVSLALGANRLQQARLKRVPPLPGSVAGLRQDCRALLAPLPQARHWPRVKELIGSGGTVRALRKLAKGAGAKEQPFTAHFLAELNARMERLDRVGLQHLPGMDEKRLDLLLAGSLILEEACACLGAAKIRATEATLRDGLLLDELSRSA